MEEYRRHVDMARSTKNGDIMGRLGFSALLGREERATLNGPHHQDGTGAREVSRAGPRASPGEGVVW